MFTRNAHNFCQTTEKRLPREKLSDISWTYRNYAGAPKLNQSSLQFDAIGTTIFIPIKEIEPILELFGGLFEDTKDMQFL